MNPASYFEGDPWSRAAAMVRNGQVGVVAAVAVQDVCPRGGMESALEAWNARIEALLGPPVRSDVARACDAISVLARYPGDVIARLFLDQAGSVPVSCFEIVGTRALLVWKPDVKALAVAEVGGLVTLCLAHPYADSLLASRGAVE